MLILILIDVQYSQKAVFSFEKGWNGQNHSSSGSHHLGKKILPSKISDPFSPPIVEEEGRISPQPLTAIWKMLQIRCAQNPAYHCANRPKIPPVIKVFFIKKT